MIEVRQPGLSTTVQDEGRPGYYHLGIPPSGAMDQYSYRLANALVGNPPGSAVLEMTYQGSELEFGRDAIIALTGAEMPARLNGETVPNWRTVAVQEGDRLAFDFLRHGARTYLAVSGGIAVPEVLESRSTYATTQLGGLEGRSLEAGDRLPLGDPPEGVTRREGVELAARFVRTYEDQRPIRVMMGLCSYRLTEASKQTFLDTEWTVTPEADRTGYRYQGARLEFRERTPPFGAGSNPSNVVDVGYPIGSIQVPDGVEPIVLMYDAVTGGGYATIGTVIGADRDYVAQSKTNDVTRFREVTLEEALEARRSRNETLQAAIHSLP